MLLRLFTAVTLLLALLGAQIAWADTLPQTSCAQGVLNALAAEPRRYRIEVQGIGADGERRLETVSGSERWRFTQTAGMILAKIEEWSEFVLQDERLVTTRYSYQQTGLGAKSYQIDFSPDQTQISRNGEVRVVDVKSGFDTLSHLLQLQIDLNCAVERTESLSYPVVRSKGVKPFEYQFAGAQRRNTPYGEQDLEVWKRVDGTLTDTLWLWPEQEYTLVYFEHQEEGDSSRLRLTR